jgi:hypothetical protein
MSKFSLSIINKIEKKIQEANTFQYIESNKSVELIEALKQISVLSGIAIYTWKSGLGLVNIRSSQTPLPATRSVLEALKYATKNHYYAVYVFPGVESKDLLEIKSTLPMAREFLTVNENTRFLFLIKEKTQFNFMKSNGEEIILFNQHTKKYKLRDNQWVLSDG